MANFTVKPDQLKRTADCQARISGQIESLSRDICTIAGRLNLENAAGRSVKNNLYRLAEKNSDNASKLHAMQSALKHVTTSYENTERAVRDRRSTETKQSLKGLLYSIGPGGGMGWKTWQVFNKAFQNMLYNTKSGGNSGGDKFDWNVKKSLVSGSVTTMGTILGLKYSGNAEGDLLGGSLKTKAKATWSPEKGNAKIEGSVEAEGHLAKGKVKGSIGKLSGEMSGTIGSLGASGKIGASLFKNGKFSPSIEGKVKAEAAAAKGSVEVKLGDDKFNKHVNASGTLLGAEAEIGGSAGVITYKDNKGTTRTEAGVQGKVGAEAYVAQGKISGGFTLLGVKIDAGISGKAGGAGVSAEGRVTTGGASGKIGAGLGLGAGLEISVDWSNFKLW